MASQIAHIVYAQKYFEKHPSKKNKDEFILGCLLPDIRRIDERIRRKDTHLCFDPIDLIFNNLTSFETGWKFHLYCDMKREDILNRHNFYSLKYTTEFWQQPAKMLEDELVYDTYNNWEKLYLYFNDPPYFETVENMTQETFGLWYAILAQYIREKPTNNSIKNFISKQPSIASHASDIVSAVDKLRKDDKVVEILKKVKDEIV